MAIDVGPACSDRGGSFSVDYTFINKANPANASGTIDHVCIWQNSVGSGANSKVGSFADEGSNVLSTNAFVDVGTIVQGENLLNAPGDFSAFNINSGEYLGAWIEDSFSYSTVNGCWYKQTDEFPYSSVTFTSHAGWEASIYATGTEAEEEEGIPIPILMNYYRQLRN